MKKLISYVLVFCLGFIVCAWAINRFQGGSGAGIQSVNAPRGGVGLLRGGSNQVREAAAMISEYVVNIDTIGRPIRRETGFFGFPFGEPEEIIPRGQASGVVFSPNGYILTNNHVVEGATKLVVTLYSGKQYPARLIGRDPKTDLAVVKIDATGLKYARFGDSNTLAVGDWVIAVGNALGLGPTVTIGVVSANKRGPINIDGKVLEQVIQTDAAINQGNSGGALADINGNLVGINTAIASTAPGGGSIGIGFAVPSSIARRIAEQLVKTGKVKRPWLGIRYAPYNAEFRRMLEARGVRNLPSEDGAMIVEVYQASPAAEAGLQPQDLILKINGRKVSGSGKAERGMVTIADEVENVKIGDRITLEVMHASTGRKGTIAVTIGEMPADFGEGRSREPMMP